MKIFTIKENQLQPFRRRDFKQEMTEEDLELLIENSGESFFDDLGVLIIGRQVTTNLNGYIDLLGLDRHGNTVVIELKRDVTPREVISQILEYASSIEPLSYKELDSIYQDYSGGEGALQDYHREFFNLGGDQVVAFNKETHLYIIAQSISPTIKQVAIYLCEKGLELYCIEFNYFISEKGEHLFTTETIVGGSDYQAEKVKSASRKKVTREEFMETLTTAGSKFFSSLFEFADLNGLNYHWGVKGFSINVEIDEIGDIPLLYGYPPNSVYGQSVYTAFEVMERKLENSNNIINKYRMALDDIGVFVTAGTNMKWVINNKVSDGHLKEYLYILDDIRKLVSQRKPVVLNALDGDGIDTP